MGCDSSYPLPIGEWSGPTGLAQEVDTASRIHPSQDIGGAFTPEDPIYFSVNGVLGISISQAADGIFPGLDERDDRMVAFKGAPILLRIQVGKVNSQTSILSTPLLIALWSPSVFIQSKRSRP